MPLCGGGDGPVALALEACGAERADLQSFRTLKDLGESEAPLADLSFDVWGVPGHPFHEGRMFGYWVHVWAREPAVRTGDSPGWGL